MNQQFLLVFFCFPSHFIHGLSLSDLRGWAGRQNLSAEASIDVNYIVVGFCRVSVPARARGVWDYSVWRHFPKPIVEDGHPGNNQPFSYGHEAHLILTTARMHFRFPERIGNTKELIHSLVQLMFRTWEVRPTPPEKHIILRRAPKPQQSSMNSFHCELFPDNFHWRERGVRERERGGNFFCVAECGAVHVQRLQTSQPAGIFALRGKKMVITSFSPVLMSHYANHNSALPRTDFLLRRLSQHVEIGHNGTFNIHSIR